MSKPLPPALVDALLDKLATDDAFREAFARDPRSALSSLAGAVELQGFTAWSCLTVSRLASKEEIARDRQLLRSQLCSALRDIPHRLDVS